MSTISKLSKRHQISDKNRRLIVKCFEVDCTASQTRLIVGVNRNTVNRHFKILRDLIHKDAYHERNALKIGNGVEIDESYFGPRRQKGKRGRGASNKIIVFGLLKRGGNVYTQVIPDTTRTEIMPIIKATVRSGADIYTDGWRSYDALAIYGYNHKKVHHEKDEFVEGVCHINGIESFWSWTKRLLAKFNGVRKDQFWDYVLESEWRFNHRNEVGKKLKRLILEYVKT